MYGVMASIIDHRDHEGRGLGRVWIDIRFGFQVFSFHVKPEKLKIQMIRTGRKISRILLEIKVQKITKTSKWQCSRFLESKKKGFYGTKEFYCKIIWRKIIAVGENFRNFHTVHRILENISWNPITLQLLAEWIDLT